MLPSRAGGPWGQPWLWVQCPETSGEAARTPSSQSQDEEREAHPPPRTSRRNLAAVPQVQAGAFPTRTRGSRRLRPGVHLSPPRPCGGQTPRGVNEAGGGDWIVGTGPPPGQLGRSRGHREGVPASLPGPPGPGDRPGGEQTMPSFLHPHSLAETQNLAGGVLGERPGHGGASGRLRGAPAPPHPFWPAGGSVTPALDTCPRPLALGTRARSPQLMAAGHSSPAPRTPLSLGSGTLAGPAGAAPEEATV